MPKSKIRIDKTPEDKITPKKLAGTGDNISIIKNLLLELYIVNPNQVMLYDMFRRITKSEGYTELQSGRASASAWFNKPENHEYISIRRPQIEKEFFDAYCKRMNIEHEGFKRKEAAIMSEMAMLTPDQIREKNLAELEAIKNNTEDPKIKADCIKQQTDLMGAKLKSTEQEISETDKLIHYFLPAPYCDDCHNRCKIEQKYEHLPVFELPETEEENDEE